MKFLYFNDLSDEKLNEMIDYCLTNSLSLDRYENTDVSDVSGQWDTITLFAFTKDDDAMLFRLRYASN